MNTRFLEALLWVARLGSFRGAAERLNLTQGAISSRISSLESDFGTRLFDRDGREIRITAAGRLLVAHAERILELTNEMESALDPSGKLTGIVRIGIIESILHTWLIPFLEQLRGVHGELEIELTAEPTTRLHEQLRRGQIDVALQTDTVLGEGIINQSIGTMVMGWIGRPEDGWLNSGPASVARLVDDRPVVTMTRGSQPHIALLQACRMERVRARHVHCVGSVAAIVRLVRAGFGVAIVPLAPFQDELNDGRLVAIPCDAPLAPLRLMVSLLNDPTRHTAHVVAELACQEALRFALSAGPGLAAPVEQVTDIKMQGALAPT